MEGRLDLKKHDAIPCLQWWMAILTMCPHRPVSPNSLNAQSAEPLDPKSQPAPATPHHRVAHGRKRWLQATSFNLAWTRCSGARVGILPTRMSGAARQPIHEGHRTAKHRREWTSNCRGCGPSTVPTVATHSAAVIKRSFRRACRRAVEYGSTPYKGRTWRPHHRSKAQVQQAVSSITAKRNGPPKNHLPQTASAPGRLQVMVWNTGGLAYHELMHWLMNTVASPPDLLIVLETRLAYDMEHTTDQYYLMHSAQPHAGVLIMVHKRITYGPRPSRYLESCRAWPTDPCPCLWPDGSY